MAKITIKHPTDPQARISLGEPDADGYVEIDVEAVDGARAAGWMVVARPEPAGGSGSADPAGGTGGDTAAPAADAAAPATKPVIA